MAVDLTLLPHLSEDALRAEAERRGLPTEGFDRDALIAAIRRAEETEAPAPRPARARAEAPPTTDRSRREIREEGAVGKARALFGRVVGIAKAAIEGRVTPSSPPPSALEADEPEEPIATKTMAMVLIDQGHLDRARTILEELAAEGDDPEVREALAEVNRRRASEVLRPRAEALHAERPGTFVSIVRDDGIVGVVWRVDDEARRRGQALVEADGALTLRVVRVRARADRSVESLRDDHGIEDAGWLALEGAEDARLVVSVGLAAEDRFASVSHAAD